MVGRLRRRAAWVLDRRFGAVAQLVAETRLQLLSEIASLRADVAAVQTGVATLRDEVAAARAEGAALRDHVSPVLRAIVTEEAANRRRLEHLRTQPEYAVPFEHSDPLVTVCIPTHDRVEMLTERALPSVLAQTHERLEVIVIGDASPPHVAAAVEALADERLRFVNLTHRYAATGADHHWLVGSVRPRNAGYALATGHWIVDFDDDDAMRPQAIEHVLAAAREQRHEVVYGRSLRHSTDGSTELMGRFPPTVHQFGWQGAAVHTSLRFLGRDLVSAAFGHPNDWFRVETMMRIGVRIGWVDEILYDYYPARLWEHQAPVPENAFVEEHAW